MVSPVRNQPLDHRGHGAGVVSCFVTSSTYAMVLYLLLIMVMLHTVKFGSINTNGSRDGIVVALSACFTMWSTLEFSRSLQDILNNNLTIVNILITTSVTPCS